MDARIILGPESSPRFAKTCNGSGKSAFFRSEWNFHDRRLPKVPGAGMMRAA